MSNLVISSYFNERAHDILAMKNIVDKLSNKRSFTNLFDENRRETQKINQRNTKRRTRSHKKYKFLGHHTKNKKSLEKQNKSSRHARRKYSLLLSQHQPMIQSGTQNISTKGGHAWLSTHKWHSKRFHMESCWGYTLANNSSSFGLKYVSRILKESVAVHDMSYVQSVELQGPIDQILSLLAHYTDPLTDWSNSLLLQGGIEKEFNFYHYDTFPQDCLGPVRLLVHSTNQIWLWVHPAIISDTLQLLEHGIQQVSEKISIKPFLNQFSRFSLRGAKSIQLLQNVFHPVSVAMKKNENSLPTDETLSSHSNGQLFLDILDCEGINNLWPHLGTLCFDVLDCRELLFSAQGKSSFRSSRTPHSLMLLTKKKEEPRFGKKRRLRWSQNADIWRLKEFVSDSSSPHSSSHSSPSSPFQSATSLPLSNGQLNKLRHQEKLLEWTIPPDGSRWTSTTTTTPSAPATAPATTSFSSPMPSSSTSPAAIELVHKPFSFPILLIRHQGHQGQASSRPLSEHPFPPNEVMGWDVIVPSSCSMIVWLALMFGGGRAIGLKEFNLVNLCSKIPTFPCDYPDTRAGQDYWKTIKLNIENQIIKRPRGKKLISSSFCTPDWSHLFPSHSNDGSTSAAEECNFAVIRNAEYLSPFLPEALFDQNIPNLYRKKCQFRRSSSKNEFLLEPLSLPFNTAIRVLIISTGRGVPKCGAQIFSPTGFDYEQWSDFHSKRHLPTTSRGRRVADWWGSCYKNGNKRNGDVMEEIPEDNNEMNDKNEERMVIGYITSSANTQLSHNLRVGMGFVEVLSLREMLHKAAVRYCNGIGKIQLLIIFKNRQSKWYRPGLIEIQS